MATKFRALYQRSKGRDLYDLWLALSELSVNADNIIHAFNQYNAFHKINISRAEYEKNIALKIKDINFLSDAKKVLPDNINWDTYSAFQLISKHLITKLKGKPWKGLSDQ
jgi:predicted nucleotidyltransferase component of viral defense system